MRHGALIAIVLLATSCGYRVVRIELPPTAGECIHVKRLDGGDAHPELAQWVSDALTTRLGPDVCAPSQSGPTLTGTIEWVGPDTPLMEATPSGHALAGSTYTAAASIRIVDGDTILWGPEGVEVSREFFSTEEPATEAAALQSHIQLLSEALAEALVDLLHDPALH